MNFLHYLCKIFVTPLFNDQKFYIPTTSGPTVLKKYGDCNPNVHSAKNMHFGGYFIEQNFCKLCGHPKMSWLFLWPPIFYFKKSVTLQLPHDPSIPKKMIALICEKCKHIHLHKHVGADICSTKCVAPAEFIQRSTLHMFYINSWNEQVSIFIEAKV